MSLATGLPRSIVPAPRKVGMRLGIVLGNERGDLWDTTAWEVWYADWSLLTGLYFRKCGTTVKTAE